MTRGLLTPPDEYFTHQVAYPHAVVGTSDPSWRERYWLSMQNTETKDIVLTCGIGHYPNQNVQEAFAVVSMPGVQHNVRLARAMLPDSHLMQVGPFSVEVLEPLRRLRLVMADNPSGISFDVEWSATMEPLLEGRHYQLSRARLIHDLVRYVQVGRASGELHVDGTSLSLTPDVWWAERDHSWGLRPLPHVEGAPPGLRPPWYLLLFAPLQFETFGLHLYLYEAKPGRPVHLSAGLMTPWGATDETDGIDAIDHELRWVEGAPAVTLEGGTLDITLESGKHLEVEIIAHPGRAHLRGGGYEGWNGWFQGHWKGEDTLEHDVWDLTDQGQFYRYAKAGSDHLVEARCNGETGFGVIEYMVLRGYEKYTGVHPPR